MKCSHIQSLLSEYLDGQLSAAQAEQVERHLTACDGCQGRWRMLRRTVRLVAHLGQEKCPVDLRAPVALAVSQTPAQRRLRFPLPMAALSGVATGIACLALLAGVVHPLFPGAVLPVHLNGEMPAVIADAAEPPSVHEQYDLTQGMGLDGLLLALPPGKAHARRAGVSAELLPRTHKSN